MSFNSVTIRAGYILKSLTINVWSDWWWLLGVSIQTILIFSFNMLLLKGMSFCRSQNDLRLTHLSASIALELWLVLYIKIQKINVWFDWWCLLFVSSQTIVIFTFDMLLINGKSFSEVKNTSNSFIHELQVIY